MKGGREGGREEEGEGEGKRLRLRGEAMRIKNGGHGVRVEGKEGKEGENSEKKEKETS